MPRIDRPGCRLSYRTVDVTPPWVEDPPPAILFVHGVSTTAALWSDWIPPLCDAYRLVLPDTRGFGASAPHDEGRGWSFDLLAGDILAVAEAEGLGRFHLVGESAGGTAALAFAAAHPERLLSLTVTNTAHQGREVRNVRGHWAERISGRGQADWADQMMDWRFHPGALPPAKARWFREEQARCSAAATLGLAELLLRSDLTEALPRITAPTLVMSPDASPFIPVPVAADLHARIAGAELRVVPHSRHGLPFSHGRDCATALREFLARRCGGAAAA